MKKYTPYGRYITGYCIGGIAFMYVCVLTLCCIFIIRVRDGWQLAILFLLMLVIVTIVLWRDKLFQRCLVFTKIDDSGFHSISPFLGKFCIPWETIHTYGIQCYSVSYLNMVVIFFSQDPSERAPKTIQEANICRSNRVVFQYREDVWNAICCYMPLNMKKNLNDAISHHRSGFFKR